MKLTRDRIEWTGVLFVVLKLRGFIPVRKVIHSSVIRHWLSPNRHLLREIRHCLMDNSIIYIIRLLLLCLSTQG